MDYYVAEIPIAPPKWGEYAPYQPDRKAAANHLARTEFKGLQAKPIAYAETAMLKPSPLQQKLDDVSGGSMENTYFNVRHYLRDSKPNDDIERIASQRVRLLAEKYVKGENSASAEVVARLDILGKRLVDRAPMVSTAQVEVLEQAAQKLVRIQASIDERARKFNL